MIMLDTSVLIAHYRATVKKDTFLFNLAGKYEFALSAVVKYEVFKGDQNNDPAWGELLSEIEILSFDGDCAEVASNIYLDLKKRRKLVPTDDILIAATAIWHQLPLATINVKHFSRIKHLELLTPG
jgi:tRNA(fMet)-specific endonuclease VapC